MSINKKIPYIKYIVRNLSFSQNNEDENQEFEKLSLELGYSDPTIETNSDRGVAVMPFKFTLNGEEAFSLSCEFQIGFNITEKLDKEQFKQIVNEESDYFSKYIENAISKIISNTLANTAFNIDEVIDIPKFSYQD